MYGDAVEPAVPDALGRLGQIPEVGARAVEVEDGAESAVIGDAALFDRLVVGRKKLCRPRLGIDPRPAAPGIDVLAALHRDDMQAPKLDHSHACLEFGQFPIEASLITGERRDKVPAVRSVRQAVERTRLHPAVTKDL